MANIASLSSYSFYLPMMLMVQYVLVSLAEGVLNLHFAGECPSLQVMKKGLPGKPERGVNTTLPSGLSCGEEKNPNPSVFSYATLRI